MKTNILRYWAAFDMVDSIIITYFISYMFRPFLGQHQGRNMSEKKYVIFIIIPTNAHVMSIK